MLSEASFEAVVNIIKGINSEQYLMLSQNLFQKVPNIIREFTPLSYQRIHRKQYVIIFGKKVEENFEIQSS